MPAQRTLARPARLEGIGLHTGEPCAVSLGPGAADSGLVFVRNHKEIPARAEFVTEAKRGVRLGEGSHSILLVEHLLAALHGLGVDNARIEVEGPELPAGDGSALPFVRLIRQAGIAAADGQRKPLLVRQPLWVGEGDRYLIALPAAGRLEICYFVDFHETVIGRQLVWFRITPRTFAREIAGARTFGFASEIAELRRRGLARGGSLENALLIDENGYCGELRFPDEIARHKVLDLLGDLRLCGRAVEARIIAVKAGHDLHTELARKLAEAA